MIAQPFADPNAAADNEGLIGPMYTSTKTECASCPAGTVIESITLLTLETWNLATPNVWTFAALAGQVVVTSFRITTVLTEMYPGIEGSNDGVSWTDISAGLNPPHRGAMPAGYADFYVSNTLPFSQYRVTLGAWSGVFSLLPDTIAVSLLNVTGEGAADEICATATATSNVNQADADAKASALALSLAQSQVNCLSEDILPPVEFSPVSGTAIGGGISVTLYVPGFPGAHIRYTADGSHVPLDPTFDLPPSLLTGVDYYTPVNIITPTNPLAVPRIKAIARYPGYADSVMSIASYVA